MDKDGKEESAIILEGDISNTLADKIIEYGLAMWISVCFIVSFIALSFLGILLLKFVIIGD